MAQKVVAMDVRMATALVGAVSNVAEFCRQQQISRQTFYKWRGRFREGGVEGLADRSRRPVRPGGLTAAVVEDLVVRERKNPPVGGEVGADAIRWRLQRGGELPREQVPSRATVNRILVRRGLVDPAPRKRPRSSLHRFGFARPNDCWQSDWTCWHLAGQAKVAIAGTLDDHSRTVCALRAGPGEGTAELVWATMLAAIGEFGVPVRSLTDNGLVYSGARRGFEVPFEANLRALGVATICSSPYHPQTCGKIERFWQTLKKWLSAQPTASTVDELNELLERFRVYYNQQRPHRALDGATPAERFAATEPGRPADRPLPAPVLHQYGTVSKYGVVLVGGNHVGVGVRWHGHRVDIIRDGAHTAIYSGNLLVRQLTIDTTRDYQPGESRTSPGDRIPQPPENPSSEPRLAAACSNGGRLVCPESLPTGAVEAPGSRAAEGRRAASAPATLEAGEAAPYHPRRRQPRIMAG